MQGSLSASQDEVVWVLTSYILATAVMTPLGGWLAQKIGRKRMLTYSIVGFTIASMLCGVAQNVPQMVAFRVLQGLAGASLMPLSQAVMLDLYPMAMIPRVMSIWSAAVILGPIFGPILGGSITENINWRWVFYINLPVGILATLGVFNFMRAMRSASSPARSRLAVVLEMAISRRRSRAVGWRRAMMVDRSRSISISVWLTRSSVISTSDATSLLKFVSA